MSNTRALAENLLRGAAEDVGTALEFDEGGSCTIEGDGGLEVSLQIDEASNSLMIYAALTSAGHRNREELFAWILELNLLDEGVRGAVIGLDRSTNMLALRYRLPLECSHPVGLSSVLLDFFVTVDALNTKISEFRQDSGAESATDSASIRVGTDAAELPRGPGPSDFA